MRRWPAAVAVTLLLLTGALLSGCGGSGSDSTGSDTAAASSGAPIPSQGADAAIATRPKQHAPDAGAKGSARGDHGSGGEQAGRAAGSPRDSRHSSASAPSHARAPQGTDHPARQPHESAESTGVVGASQAVVRKLRKRCPKGMERSACDDLVESYVAAQNPQPQPPAESGQCPESLSRSECEAVVAQQKAAAEQGPSVTLEECLANMTPRCEALLRSSFEAQSEARREAGE